jgi:hypothetical protein
LDLFHDSIYCREKNKHIENVIQNFILRLNNKE